MKMGMSYHSRLKRGRRARLPEKREKKTPLPQPEKELAEAAEATGVSAEIYRQVGEEVLNNDLEPAMWARALAECEGSRDEALTYYVRYRAEDLQREKRKQVTRFNKVEQRMVGNFQDFKAQPVCYHPVYGETGPMSLVDALFWHTVAVVGMVGCFLALGLLWPDLGFQVTWKMALMLGLVMQAIPLVGWWFGHRSDKTLGYGQVARMSAFIAMLASTGIGVVLLVNPSESTGLALYRKEVIRQSQLVQFPGKSEPVAQEDEAAEAPVVAER